LNILEIDNLKGKLNQNVLHSFSPRQKYFYFHDYFELLLQADEQIVCSYLLEQIESYIDSLHSLYPTGLNPSLIQNITKQTSELLKVSCLSDFHLKIKDAASKLNREYQPVKNALNGELQSTDSSDVLYFPVLENDGSNNLLQSGFLESIKVEIKEAKAKTNFYISPSGREIEKLISEQIEISWNLSIEHLKKYVKRFNLHHDVFIHFDNKLGYYTGNSLGAALSLVFLKELLNYYNAPVIFLFSGRVAVTGGLDKDENILEVSEKVLEKKVVTIFFSTVQTFVVADSEKQFAAEKLNVLKKDFPKRNLKIIGVEDLDDLLARRNVVKIRKQKVIVRSAKFAFKNWAAVFLMTIVIFLVYVGQFYDFDSNPAILINKGYWLSVQNKNGKELWKKRMGFSVDIEYKNRIVTVSQKIIDIDGDGSNEVLLTTDDQSQYNPPKQPGRVACFSSEGNQVWEYYFRDTVLSVEMEHSSYYVSHIIDTVTINETKAIVCFAANVLYPSAVYFLDLKTGERIGTTMWHTGHLQSGKIIDINKDGKKELIMFGLSNAYRRVIAFSVDIDKIDGQLPTEGVRKFVGLKDAEINAYVLLPNTDYTLYLTSNYNRILPGNISINENVDGIFNYLMEGEFPNYKGILIELDGNLNVTKIDPSLEFEIARDSLVVKGELKLPLTHTEEYQKILYDQIRYWDGEKFITREKYKTSTTKLKR